MLQTNRKLISLAGVKDVTGLSRDKICDLALANELPPPILTTPIRYWSSKHIEDWMDGRLQKNQEGVWFNIEQEHVDGRYGYR
ncbi:MAG: hypothetical protein AAGB04_31440, partial [Pseudomonadota bacterium]